MRALSRITFATVFLTGVTIAAAPVAAQIQQKFPSKPVRVVVSNPAGSQGDTLARMISQKMSESWGRSVVVDNRTGAAGIAGRGHGRQGHARRPHAPVHCWSCDQRGDATEPSL